ncbi:TPR repeat [Trypanosoma brucei equiperdum]|uniref:TPR repeat n=1 Tax=Trypanosoma brucei equiperdum TaxID=630700 RepID=A0A3L6KVK2_9TRYP|nr:TPR repeat [Trypanosoma brucei equiperdum]
MGARAITLYVLFLSNIFHYLHSLPMAEMTEAPSTGHGNPIEVGSEAPPGIDPMYYALSLLRRRRLEECVAISSRSLATLVSSGNSAEKKACGQSPNDGHIERTATRFWSIQMKALAQQNWFEEIDVDDDGVNDVLLDGEQTVPSNATAVGTSLGGGQPPAAANPGKPPSRMSCGKGTMRPLSSRCGFARPGTHSARLGSSSMSPVTARLARVGTASLQSVPGGTHLDLQKLDVVKYVQDKPIVAKLLCDYLLHVAHRPRMVLELCNYILSQEEQRNWWWLSRLGQAHYRLGQLREAEQQFKSALALQENVMDVLRLAKVFVRMDQPLKALEVLSGASSKNVTDHHLRIAMARLYEELQDKEKSCDMYRRVLQLDSTNVEAIACIAAHHFYENQQPEVALRLYRRLLQMGVQTTELWNNLGLCCFYSSQYDIALSCLQRAAAVAPDDESLSDVWFNIGHVGIATGDLSLAERAFRVAVAANPQRAEALNNLAVLQLRAGNVEAAYSDITMALAVQPLQLESLYNAALIAYSSGFFEQAYAQLQRALDVCPDHPESVGLQAEIRKILAAP